MLIALQKHAPSTFCALFVDKFVICNTCPNLEIDLLLLDPDGGPDRHKVKSVFSYVNIYLHTKFHYNTFITF